MGATLGLALQRLWYGRIAPAKDKSFRAQAILVTALIVLTTALRWTLHSFLHDAAPFYFYLPSVIITTAYGGLTCGLVTTIISVLAAWFFFIPEYLSFRLNDPRDSWLIGVYFVISFVVVFTVELLRRTLVSHYRNATELAEQKQQLLAKAEALEKTDHELRKRAENLETLVRERTAKLEETIASLEDFTYSVSHDLRSPLRGMQAFAHLTLEEYGNDLPQQGREYLERIEKSARRLDRLIQDVLSYALISRTEVTREAVDVDKVVRQAVAETALANPRSHFDVAYPLHRMWGNTGLLAQCISNLLGNAAKFVPAGRVAQIKIWTYETGGRVRLNVRDSGIGLAPELLTKIFQPFQRGHPEAGYEGTGIGLAIVQKAVDRMGGSVGAESQVGEGSTFWIELPRGEPLLAQLQRTEMRPTLSFGTSRD